VPPYQFLDRTDYPWNEGGGTYWILGYKLLVPLNGVYYRRLYGCGLAHETDKTKS
jgi:hypothetical protein